MKERALRQYFILCSLDPQAKQEPVSLQHSPLCLFPQCVQKGETSPLEEPPGALATDGAGRIVLLSVACAELRAIGGLEPYGLLNFLL